MNGDKFFNILGGIVVVATITALVLPGRQTPAIITSFFGGFADSIRAAISGK